MNTTPDPLPPLEPGNVIAAPNALEGFETKLIPIAELHESPKNPRRYFSQVGLEELAASIRADGVRVALVARPRLEGGGYEIAAGHRRYRAAKLAGVSHVPVQVRDLTDAQFVDWLAFENANRDDLNALEEAQGWKLWMDETLADVGDLMKKTGLKQAYVYGRLKLLEAIPDAQRAYIDGRIKIGHLEDIARIPSPKDQRRALKVLEPSPADPEKQFTTREFKAWIKKNLHLDLTAAPFSRTDATLLPTMGACGPCPHRLGNAADFDPENDVPEMCTRPECYEEKAIAHVNAAMSELRGSVVFVSEMVSTKGEGVLPKGDWHETALAMGARDALIVEGPRMGQRIRVVVQERIAAPAAAPQQQRTPTSTSVFISAPAPQKPRKKTPEEVEAEAAELREQEESRQRENAAREQRMDQERKVRLSILRALMAKVKWPPKREEIAALLDPDVLAELPDAVIELLPEIGLEPGVHFQEFSDLSADDFARVVVLQHVAGELEDYVLNHGCDRFHAVAKRYGVDVAKIREKAKEAEGGTRKAVVGKLAALGERMSLRAYARHRGCALNAVQTAIKAGRIERGADGLIDAASADAAWPAKAAKKSAPKKKGGKK